MEENTRKGKIRDLLNKIGNIKGIFHPYMGTIKDRNGGGRVEAEDIKEMEGIHGRTVQKRS